MANKSKNSTIKTKRQIIAEKYKYEVEDVVKYLGGLYPELKTIKGKVLSRTCSRACNHYEIEFENGIVLKLKEDWIKIWEDDGNEN